MRARKLNKFKLTLAAVLFGIFSVLLYQFGLFVMVLWLNVKNPSSSAFMDAARARLHAVDPNAKLEFEWVPYDQISTNLKRAVIASEDANFMSHNGVEWDAIRQAWEYNRRQNDQGKARRRGGSTITQQLAKNMFLSEKRSYVRKGQELVLTYMMELVMSKQRILELYLNVAQWGQYTFGAQSAAQKYYKMNASQLNANQSARLAVMLPNPVFYETKGNTQYLRSRTSTIQQRMRQVSAP